MQRYAAGGSPRGGTQMGGGAGGGIVPGVKALGTELLPYRNRDRQTVPSIAPAYQLNSTGTEIIFDVTVPAAPVQVLPSLLVLSGNAAMIQNVVQEMGGAAAFAHIFSPDFGTPNYAANFSNDDRQKYLSLLGLFKMYGTQPDEIKIITNQTNFVGQAIQIWTVNGGGALSSDTKKLAVYSNPSDQQRDNIVFKPTFWFADNTVVVMKMLPGWTNTFQVTVTGTMGDQSGRGFKKPRR